MVTLCAVGTLGAKAQDAEGGADAETARRQLFSNPTGPMADVHISESIVFLGEGASSHYTVQLTHAPGMREDETVRRRRRCRHRRARCSAARHPRGPPLLAACPEIFLGLCRSISTTTR